jgi:hypothetical protein
VHLPKCGIHDVHLVRVDDRDPVECADQHQQARRVDGALPCQTQPVMGSGHSEGASSDSSGLGGYNFQMTSCEKGW